MKTHETIVEEITPIIADVLVMEPEEVMPSSKFFEDLGGESIDFLDLSFRLERHYGVHMPVQAMAGSADLPADPQGRLTAEGLSRLKSTYPFLDYADFDADPQLGRIKSLITVEAIACLVQQALSQAPGVLDGN